MAGIKIEWAQFGLVDSFEVHRKTVTFPETELNAPIATGIIQNQFWDEQISEGVTYYYRIVAKRSNSIAVSDIISAIGITFEAPYAINSEYILNENKVNLTWMADGEIDSYTIYRSETLFDETNLPVPIAINISGESFIDTNINNDVTYYYRIASISKNKSKLSYFTSVTTAKSLTGMWIVACTENPSSSEGNSYDLSNGVKDQAWIDNFGNTQDFALSKRVIGASNADATNGATRFINKPVLGRSFALFGQIVSHYSDVSEATLEFLDSNAQTVFALSIKNHPSYGASVALSYGSNLNNLIIAPSITPSNWGYSLDGILDFTPNKVIFTKNGTSNTNGSFEYAINTSQIKSIKISKFRAYRYFGTDNFRSKLYFKCVS